MEQIARYTQFPVSTVYRYVHTLYARNFLEHGVTAGTYVLGHRLISLARKVPGVWDMARIAYPFMKDLSEEIGETVLLLQKSGDMTICIERVEADQIVKFSFERGKRLPLHAGASARIVMAFLPEDEVNRLLLGGYLTRYTANTITNAESLKRTLAETRRQGFAISDEEMDAHLRAIAVPILDSSGNFLAGLSVVGPMFRLTGEKTLMVLQILPKYARLISEQFDKYLVNSYHQRLDITLKSTAGQKRSVRY